jgi:hypothetical protein
MKDGNPACSLDPERLERRLDEIAAIGADALASRGLEDGRHVLRFRTGDETRRRLEAIVAAEGECCSFLDLSLGQSGDALTLSISAPGNAEALAAGLAAAFDRQG